MWTFLQIAVCVVFALFVAFWIGKKIGQRRYYKVQEEMKSLELYFKHLMEDMEMVANHNMKVLEGSTGELKELLEVADKKCFYANDLLREIDEGVDSLKRRNLSAPAGITSIDSGVDKKFRREVQVALEELLKKLVKVTDRVAILEDEYGDSEAQPDQNEIYELIRNELKKQLQALPREKEQYEDTPKFTGKAADKAADKVIDKALERYGERVVPIKPHREAFASSSQLEEKAVAVSRTSAATGLKTAVIDDKARVPVPVKKTDMEKILPVPPMGFPVKEVLELFNQGISTPQIARTLNMGKGEIELILKIYGESARMRKIM